MSRKISSTPGKIFVWLIAIAVALLVEGFMLNSSNTLLKAEQLVTVTVMETSPQATIGHVGSIANFAAFLFKLSNSVR